MQNVLFLFRGSVLLVVLLIFAQLCASFNGQQCILKSVKKKKTLLVAPMCNRPKHVYARIKEYIATLAMKTNFTRPICLCTFYMPICVCLHKVFTEHFTLDLSIKS